ncbi:hypothetical protein BDN72DRAFT_860183 [Pluteus cervinus]|uniref:Uncharacterized protein n=1 Tax=Pluteus cervinus TaxID=181527 RepID=A0ACD3AL40_9AGAR|nr:hypothetical protein BDN72DRAFT_860183 [Pluteus cervinus]
MATTILLPLAALLPPIQYATRPISRQSSHSAGSASSSTLIVTPVSCKLRERYGADFPPSPPTLSQLTSNQVSFLSQQWVPPPSSGQPQSQDSGTGPKQTMAGYVQPHVSNVPRRRKILLPSPREDAPIQRISAPPSPHTPKSPLFDLRPAMIEVDEERDLATPLPIALPSLPMLVQIPTVPAIDSPSLFPGYGISGPVDIVVDIDPPSVPSVDLRSSTNGVRPSPPPSGPPPAPTNLINLPRRRRQPLTVEEVERERRRSWERNHHLLELGNGSGVFVALADEDELEQQRIPGLRSGWGGGKVSTTVIKLLRGRINEGREAGRWVERSSVNNTDNSTSSSTELDMFLQDEDSDDGITSLSSEQLSQASTFCSNSRTILVIAPRSSPADAISLAAYLLVTRFQSTPYSSPSSPILLSSKPSPSPRSPASFSSPKLLPTFQLPRPFLPDSCRECGYPDGEGYSSVHTVFVHFHDLWLVDSMSSSDDESEGVGLGRATRVPPSEVWRGAVSRDGMDYLAEAVATTMQ